MPSTPVFGDQQPIVGREREQELLRSCLADAVEGRGSLVLVSGEAGIGKTTLVRDLMLRAREQGTLVLSGSCYDLTTTPPYGPWSEAIRDYRPSGAQPLPPVWFGNPEELGKIGSQPALFEETRDFFTSLARHVRRVTAVDPSPGMTQLLRSNVERLGIENVDVLPPEMCPPAGRPEKHDVSLAALVVYEVPNISEFLDAMERHATRLCVALVAELGCGFTPPEPVFELLHGEPYTRPPALREFLAILSARRRRFDITNYPISSSPEDLDEGLRRWWRRTFLVEEGSAKDARLRELMIEHYGIGGGQIEIAGNFGAFTALVTWEPPAL